MKEDKQKILAVGDLHCNFGLLNKLIATEQPDIILQCGDFGWWPHMHDKFWPRTTDMHDQYCIKPGDTKIYWCDGNHENHDDIQSRLEWDRSGEYSFAGAGTYYMPRGTVLTLPDGRNVVFFGGAESIDKHMRTEGVSWWRGELPNHADYEFLESNLKMLGIERIDIMITHTAPQSVCVELGFRNGDRVLDPTTKFLDYVLDKYSVKDWYFGHFHDAKTGRMRGCNWTALHCADKFHGNWWCEVK